MRLKKLGLSNMEKKEILEKDLNELYDEKLKIEREIREKNKRKTQVEDRLTTLLREYKRKYGIRDNELVSKIEMSLEREALFKIRVRKR